ncbi:hypothetical protein IV76_GL001631 [Carnobacterium maltaromaticum]|nr:hypothetical protein IV76_GL001631 [Carnobacterium maltaromaticum]
MNIPENGIIKYRIITGNNTKLKTILENEIDRKIYMSGLDYVEYLLKSNDENDLFISQNAHSNYFLPRLRNSDLPDGFILTEPQFAKTNQPNDLFEKLLQRYIGKRFLIEGKNNLSMQIKSKAVHLIEKNIVVKGKIKKNIKIKPVDVIPLNYTIDFGYEENNKLNIIQTMPDKLLTTNEWFQRMSLISNNYSESGKISLLYNSAADSNKDKTAEQMMRFLESNDNRIESFDIFSNTGEKDFNTELERIEKVAGSIDKINSLLVSLSA